MKDARALWRIIEDAIYDVCEKESEEVNTVYKNWDFYESLEKEFNTFSIKLVETTKKNLKKNKELPPKEFFDRVIQDGYTGYLKTRFKPKGKINTKTI